jgi:hypothetical protein
MSCLFFQDGLDILQQILQRDDLPKQIRARILEYMVCKDILTFCKDMTK